MTAERTTRRADPSELEGGGVEQTWGQGEGHHEATIPQPADETPTASGEGRPDDPELPRSRNDEGMER